MYFQGEVERNTHLTVYLEPSVSRRNQFLATSLRMDEPGATLLRQIPSETSELCFGNTHLLREAAPLDPVVRPSRATGICSLRALQTGRRHCQDAARRPLGLCSTLGRRWPKGQRQGLAAKSGRGRSSPWQCHSGRAPTGPSSSFNSGSDLEVTVTVCCRALTRGYGQLPAWCLLREEAGPRRFTPKRTEVIRELAIGLERYITTQELR